MSTPAMSAETEPKKAAPASRRISAAIIMGLAIAVVGSEPAFAQSAGIETALESIVSMLTGSVGKLIAAIAIAGVGLAWLTGHINVKMAFAVVVGIAIVFSATDIAALLGAG